MIDRTVKLRWRRRFRRGYRQVEDIGVQAESNLEKHFFRRLTHLEGVRRFVLSWLLLICLLIFGAVAQTRSLSQYYQVFAPAPGGTFTEGVMGTFTNANPLYATSSADASVSRLLFSGLMKYDQNNQLVGDLAQKIEADERGIRYVVTLKDNLQWHDGQPLTSADVLFTYQTVQNPDARSPLFSGWQGVTFETPDEKTIVFILPNALSAFPHALTTGIIPRHLLGHELPENLRTARFNSVHPIGSGPFEWSALEVAGTTQEDREERIGFIPYDHYHAGKPQMEGFIIRTFRSEERMLGAFERGELKAMAGLSSIPDNMSQGSEVQEYSIPLTGEVMVFFKNSVPPFTDPKVRQALTQAVDVPAAVSAFGYPVIVTRGPLLEDHIGYDKALNQLPTDIAAANRLLDEAGWKTGENGMRSKDGQPLVFRLYAQNTSEYASITANLQKSWRAVGVDTQVVMLSDSDIQGTLGRHDYEALLYGISLGTDPDVFAYWHSSQINPQTSAGLNLSEYKNGNADKALEAGRTRADTVVRAVKYKPFLEAWRMDAPALSLYQPRFLYVTHGEIANFEPKALNSASDRFANVHNWMIRQERTIK